MPTTEGIDCSNNNGVIDWSAVKAAGKAFAIVKRSEGVHYADPTFDANWSGARSLGAAGSYHFCRPDLNSPEAEATYFVSLLPALQPGDLVALDVEKPGSDNLAAWVLACAQAVEKAIGFPPLIYSFAAFITEQLGLTALGHYPLWLADWAPSIPSGIGPWASVALWQYSGTGACPGVVGQVDLNRISRDLAALKLLGKPAPTPPPTHYPYSARVVKPGDLKSQPTHASSPAIDKRHRPVTLHVADKEVQVTGPAVADPNGRDWWLPCKLMAPEQIVDGWFLRDSLAKDV